MPTETLYIRSVLPRPISGGGTVYDVCGETRIASTFRPWLAALCERAMVTGRTVEIGWEDGRYGNDLVTVRLLPQDSEQVA